MLNLENLETTQVLKEKDNILDTVEGQGKRFQHRHLPERRSSFITRILFRLVDIIDLGFSY